MSPMICDRCGDPAEVVIRIIDGQLPERRPRVDLCRGCAAKFGKWLAQVPPPAGPVSLAAADDQADDD